MSANPSTKRPMACLAVLVLAVSPVSSAFGDESPAVNQQVHPANVARATTTTGQPASVQSRQPTAGNSSLPSHAALGVLLVQSADAVDVVEVITGSPAARAGMLAGDRIRFVGDVRIRTIENLTDEIGACSPGTTIELTIRRNGRRQIVEATLAAWNATFPDRKIGKQSYSYKSYSYGPSTGSDRAALQLERQRMRALEQRIDLLQQRLNAMQRGQQVNQYDADGDWWGRVRRGETDNDPALFQ